MKANRLICILFIIGSVIFASFYGGNISYALLYVSVFVPVVSFLYTVYVYARFKIYQSLDSHMVVKGDWNNYSFVLGNEDFITFRNVKVNFLYDKSTIKKTDETLEFSLLPGESEHMETQIRCNYRGEYYIGVKSVEITDFLYLFAITYPISSKLKVVVLPRILKLEQLGIAPAFIDPKNPVHYSNTVEEELNTEVRRYIPGDNKKRIHWKASAKVGELLSRKYYKKPKAEAVLFMDLMKIEAAELNVIIAEDKIIESILAVANYYVSHNIACNIIFDMGGARQIPVYSKRDFNAFYEYCVNIRFNAGTPVGELMSQRLQRGDDGNFYLVATNRLDKDLYFTSLKVISQGNRICILYISDDVSEATKALTDDLTKAGADVYHILPGDEIEEILGKKAI